MGKTVYKTQRRVWDLLNAGPLHRFTVSGLLVSNCLVLDYTSNLERHAPLDEISSTEQTPARTKKDAEKKEKEEREEKERAAKHRASVLLTDATPLRVLRVAYKIVPAKQPNARHLQVQYLCEGNRWVSQWLCVEYPRQSWPYRTAASWFVRRNLLPPNRAEEALRLAQRSPKPEKILVVKDGKWDRVTMEYFD